MLKFELMKLITSLLSDQNVTYGIAGPNSDYPIVTYAFVTTSLAGFIAYSFTADTESFMVQFSAFDTQSDGERLLESLNGVMETIKLLKQSEGVVEVRYLGGTGPTFLDSEREWRCTADYRITMAKDTVPSNS